MRKFLSALCATALTASVAVTGAMPVNAAPAYVPIAPAPVVEHSDVVKVQDRRWRRGGPHFRNGRVDRNIHRGGPRSARNWDGHRGGWHNGHRGYRHKRHRHDRYYNGFWFPAAAFLGGAIVGGALNSGPRYYGGRGGNAHVEWCYNRYRSYRASDNTFQPYNGPRRQCYSPYG